MNGWSLLMLHSFLNPIKQATAGLREPQDSTGSSQIRITVWLSMVISKPSTSSSHLRLLYSSGRVTPGKTQVEADLGLYHLGISKASIPSGQLQTMLEHPHPAPTQLILHEGRKLVVGGHSQSL